MNLHNAEEETTVCHPNTPASTSWLVLVRLSLIPKRSSSRHDDTMFVLQPLPRAVDDGVLEASMDPDEVECPTKFNLVFRVHDRFSFRAAASIWIRGEGKMVECH